MMKTIEKQFLKNSIAGYLSSLLKDFIYWGVFHGELPIKLHSPYNDRVLLTSG